MIADLLGRGDIGTKSADVVVVGAGIAGLIMATTLARLGHRVLVLESGAARQDADTHPLNAVEHVGTAVYHGATTGRARCLGGTSTRWGGGLLPMLEGDCTFHKQGWDGDWLDLHPELIARLPQAEALFALPATPYEDADLAPPAIGGTVAFVPRLPKWPSFGRRNVASLFASDLARPDGPEVLLNATVTGFRFAPDGDIQAIEAQAPDGSRVTATAPRFVMAAGAIESTRLLLLADRAADERIFAPHDVIGRYFHDHLSIDIAKLEVPSLTAFNRHFGFRFEGSAMRSLRFEASEALRRAHDLPAALAQITFATEQPGGFDAVRQMLRRLQRREIPALDDIAMIARASPWIARAAWWRYVHRRLLFPAGGKFRVNVVIEQEPRADNRITLGETHDGYGNPLARIDWSVGPRDRAALLRIADLFLEAWGNGGYAKLADVRLLDYAAMEAEFATAGGTAHPGGTTRLGASPSTGVLDREFRAFGIPNLTVTATSAFPNAGAANPTMMLILATLRAADRIDGELRRSRVNP